MASTLPQLPSLPRLSLPKKQTTPTLKTMKKMTVSKKFGLYKISIILNLITIVIWIQINYFANVMHIYDHTDSYQKQLESNFWGPPTSIFDCEGRNGKCKYFYPQQFFYSTANSPAIINGKGQKDGPGGKFLHIYEHIQDLMKKNELWVNMPRVGSPTFAFDEHNTNPNTGQPFYRHNVTFIHVHKVGGTTIMTSTENRGTHTRLKRNKLFNWKDNYYGQNLYVEHLQTATKYKKSPNEWGKDDHMMFAFIRDPLDRFISSIGQAMGANGSQDNKVSKTLRKKCVQNNEYSVENSRFTLQCCINYIKNNGYYFEIHFTPQAIEIAFATQLQPIPVAVFQYEQSYKDAIAEMGIDPEYKQRDGQQEGYRVSPLLTGMTSADYTSDLKRQVCELYEVDVIMARSLGFRMSSCDDFLRGS